ncbi:hypothetical protein FGSG_13158 [Fusarium graminearum PH-1]|uniref:hypothetical protein n=1 Tax=Gibberella zeae (strain ATCC MYA-4620 / CBS 123657 / FGSC 9075 / NRRL 31084 / PH-1) TaxID=229533 RepID=UPI00021F1886|nr:hypothetical protein FGSG_13158 [Fusarium graminearum PH-1]ESU13775.1 hypothetical protein FGSG_13158 [Fusarium graminearum PH-1]|eukprot:XP_011327282.1 hypothetical protein FGSG_13158 [Fusarium graminearum PH-1]
MVLYLHYYAPFERSILIHIYNAGDPVKRYNCQMRSYSNFVYYSHHSVGRFLPSDVVAFDRELLKDKRSSVKLPRVLRKPQYPQRAFDPEDCECPAISLE